MMAKRKRVNYEVKQRESDGEGKKSGEREQKVHQRRQGVSFPTEPDSANGQLVALRDEFRGPF